MNIPLKPHYADWIAKQVDSGRYASEIEAIEEAIAAKIEEDAGDRAYFRERLRMSEEDIKAGRVVPADVVLQQLRDRLARIESQTFE